MIGPITNREYHQAVRHIKNENKRFGTAFVEIPKSEWPVKMGGNLLRVFRNNEYMVQLYKEDGGQRISVNKCMIDRNGRWLSGFSWDDLMYIKRSVGFADSWAYEVYPPDKDIVNVSNMRHLFIPETPTIGWGLEGE